MEEITENDFFLNQSILTNLFAALTITLLLLFIYHSFGETTHFNKRLSWRKGRGSSSQHILTARQPILKQSPVFEWYFILLTTKRTKVDHAKI